MVHADNAATASGAPVKGAPEATPQYSQVLLLKRSGPEPLYYQLARSFEQAVESGAILPGTRLISEKDMARELKIALSTVRRAWAYLEAGNVLLRRGAAGTVVR